MPDHDWYHVDNDENVDHEYWECGNCYEKRAEDPTRLVATETFFNKADGELVCVTRDDGAGYYVLYCTGPKSFLEDRFENELEYFIPNDLVAP